MDLTVFLVIGVLSALDCILGAKYSLHKQEVTWFDAVEKCKVAERSLAKITSQEDQDYVVNNFKDSIKGFVWLGLKGVDNTTRLTWVDDSEVVYANWAVGFPDHENGVNCARIRYFDYMWDTVNCSTPQNYLCQDTDIPAPYVVTMQTKITGVVAGLCTVGGLVLVICILLQLKCFRGETPGRQVVKRFNGWDKMSNAPGSKSSDTLSTQGFSNGEVVSSEGCTSGEVVTPHGFSDEKVVPVEGCSSADGVTKITPMGPGY
ncbi:macrophage mannose receptor 1-like [Physella acuta]|uniref:macrophage mannose receptor 1-like n=1 Tax=Physella acuta TaxID=109671 RepID=UPI0027DD389D|nr:macrophage mannose receptor 1-like [Physella acuta]